MYTSQYFIHVTEPIVKITLMIVFPIHVKMEEAVLMESTLMFVFV